MHAYPRENTRDVYPDVLSAHAPPHQLPDHDHDVDDHDVVDIS